MAKKNMVESKELKRVKVKSLIEKNGISTFEEVVLFYGPTNTATLFGSNTDTVKSRIKKPEKFRVEEIYRLAELFEVSHAAIFTLIDNQYKQNKSKKKSNTKKDG